MRITFHLFHYFLGKLSALILEDLSKSTRKSLSQRRSNTKQMFFDTMEDESTLGVSQLIDDAEVSQAEVQLELSYKACKAFQD